MLSNHRDELILRLLSCIHWKGSRSALHPVLSFVQEANSKVGSGWLQRKDDNNSSKRKNLCQEDETLFAMMMIAMSACGDACNLCDRRDELCKAFGVSRRQKQFVTMVRNQSDSKQMLPLINHVLQFGATDVNGSITIAPSTRKESPAKTPSKDKQGNVDNDDEIITTVATPEGTNCNNDEARTKNRLAEL